MKRKNASLFGNVLMGLGLVVMVVGVGYSILNQLPQFNLPQFFAHGAILSIFCRGSSLAGRGSCRGA
ncbi:putative membrane protein [Salmonella enterica subsp. enterica]|uniref:Putative membrane protein n=1 Tax=Salmonella enterica I TaxID=59201 RepID=A0A3S4HVN7_SALET|nr:putative membrane protein [Salmonella enterica subsp. enterica]